MPNPTWGNHTAIMKDSGLTPASYTYYDPETCSYNHQGFLNDIAKADEGAVFMLHACAHNPTVGKPRLSRLFLSTVPAWSLELRAWWVYTYTYLLLSRLLSAMCYSYNHIT